MALFLCKYWLSRCRNSLFSVQIRHCFCATSLLSSASLYLFWCKFEPLSGANLHLFCRKFAPFLVQLRTSCWCTLSGASLHLFLLQVSTFSVRMWFNLGSSWALAAFGHCSGFYMETSSYPTKWCNFRRAQVPKKVQISTCFCTPLVQELAGSGPIPKNQI